MNLNYTLETSSKEHVNLEDIVEKQHTVVAFGRHLG